MPPGSAPGSWNISLICWLSHTRHFIVTATLNLRWIQQHRDEVVPSRIQSLISKWEQVQMCFSVALPNTSWMKVIIFFWWSVLLGCLYLNVANRAFDTTAYDLGLRTSWKILHGLQKRAFSACGKCWLRYECFPYATVFLESTNTLTSFNKFLRKYQQASPSCALS